MANYNLGSVQGEILITYNGRGVQAAEADIQLYLREIERLRAELARAQADLNNNAAATRSAGKESSDAGEKVGKLGNAMVAVSKIPFMVGAAQAVIGFGAAIAPIAGLMAVLPAVGLTVATVFATVKMATAGMGDAFTAVASGDAKALDEAMKKLAPNAQAVVREYAKIQPVLKGMQLDVQNTFWKDQASIIGDLAGKYLPTLHNGFVQVAGAAGNLFAGSLINITENEAAMGSLNNIFGDTSTTLNQMGGALGDVLVGVINMAGAASNWIPLWTNGLSDITSGFAAWSGSAAGQQQINQWISQGANVLGQLVKMFSNLGSIVAGVFNAMETGSGGMLQNLIALTGQMATWVQSAEGQKILNDLFTLTHQVFLQVLQILTLIVPVIGAIVGWFSSLSPQTQAVVASFLAWGLVIGKVLALLGPLISFLIANSAAIGSIIGVAGTVIGALGNILMAIIRLAAGLAMNAIRMAASWLIAMGPIGWIIIAVVALVALIIYNWDWISAKTQEIWGAIMTWLSDTWNGIIGWATGIWNGISQWISTIWDAGVQAWQVIWNSVVAFLQPIWDTIVSIITVAWDVIKNIFIFVAAVILALFFTIWNPLSALVQTVWNAIVSFLTTVWNGIVSIATTVWNAITSAISTAVTAVQAFITPIWNAIVSWLTGVWNNIVSVATSVWNAITTAISTAVTAVGNFIRPIWDGLVAWLTGIWNTVSSAANTVWNAIANVVRTATQAVSNFVMPIWNSIVSFLTGVWNTIVAAVTAGGRNVLNAIVGLWNGIVSQASNAINVLVSAGKNIVIGLWNGIVSMGSWLYGQIMGWIRSVVPGPVLQFLGIASPSKYFRDEVGKQIPAGIAGGIEDNSRIASAAAATMAHEIGKAGAVAADQEMKVSQQLMPMAGLSNLPQDIKSRLGSLAVSVGATSSTSNLGGSAVATASTPGAIAGNTKSIQIGNITIPVTGNLDPTNAVAWRKAIEEIREAITNVEASYR